MMGSRGYRRGREQQGKRTETAKVSGLRLDLRDLRVLGLFFAAKSVFIDRVRYSTRFASLAADLPRWPCTPRQHVHAPSTPLSGQIDTHSDRLRCPNPCRSLFVHRESAAGWRPVRGRALLSNARSLVRHTYAEAWGRPCLTSGVWMDPFAWMFGTRCSSRSVRSHVRCRRALPSDLPATSVGRTAPVLCPMPFGCRLPAVGIAMPYAHLSQCVRYRLVSVVASDVSAYSSPVSSPHRSAAKHSRHVRCRSRIVRSTSTLRCPAPSGRGTRDIGLCPVCRGARMHLHLRPRHPLGGFPAISLVFSCVRGDRSRFGRDPSVGIVCSFPVADQIVFRPRICTIRCPTHVP